ncbi:MAG: hypothetical protein KDD89_14775 [Anaerolineales bacterium]|nr:hypothetical protein [Anaerolineales bacterium]
MTGKTYRLRIQQMYVLYVLMYNLGLGRCLMPQLHFYVSEETAVRVREKAESVGLSVSKYVAELVKNEVEGDWPEGFFEEVVGGWEGEPLERAPQGTYEIRLDLFGQSVGE